MILTKGPFDYWSCSYLLIGNVKEVRCTSWSDEGPGGWWTEVPDLLTERGLFLDGGLARPHVIMCWSLVTPTM